MVRRLDAFLIALEPVRIWACTTRGKRILNVFITLVALGVSVLAARHFASTGWPLQNVDPWLAAAAGLLIIAGYPLKAWGWQRVFRPSERPAAMSLAAANGAASVTGAALPGRFDEVVRIAVIRRYPSCPAKVSTLALSLFFVGLLDAAAMMPIATSAAATSDTTSVQAGLSVVAATGLGAGLLVLLLPRLMRSGRLIKYRLARWVHERLIPLREARTAALFIFGSWVVRAVGLYLLLAAMGMSLSFPLAIGFLCASAAASALPIAPAAGAAAQAGGGAALLIASGVPTNTAVGFAISAQALVIFAGIAVLVVAMVAHGAERLLARRARLAAL
jgi:Lysylphosphatidylglycerol synthase TM region